MTRTSNFYAGSPLDRLEHRRRDAQWVRARLDGGPARVVPVWRGRNLVLFEQGAPRWVTIDATETWWRDIAGEPVLLGMADERVYFAADFSPLDDPANHDRLAALGEFVDLRSVGPLLARDEGSVMAHARGLVWWHARHRFCGVCGHPTVNADSGSVRRCADPDCATSHFPRTDPAVIMLVHDGDRCLLGRHPRFPPGMYSTLAGFVEPGECLEEAVAREVHEETRVRVGDVTYHSSQPWPFPASIMLGFHARALSTEIRIDQDELEDARWFTRDWILAAGDSDAFRLPRADSIARRLIEDWLARPPA